MNYSYFRPLLGGEATIKINIYSLRKIQTIRKYFFEMYFCKQNKYKFTKHELNI